MLSIVVPCHDSAETLGDQLEALSLQSSTECWELIVADNGSQDDSVAIARAFAPRLRGRLRVIDAGARRGAAHARNAGARAAAGDRLAFVDADDVVDRGWVTAMSRALEQHRFVASRFEFDRLNPPWLLKARGTPQSDGVQRLWYPPYALHAGGCGLGIHRELHEAVGGFDESLPKLMDTDYCIRVQRTGATLHFANDAVIHVRHRDTAGGLFRQASAWARYNTLMFARHQPEDTAVRGAWRGWARRSWRLAKRARWARRSRTRRAAWTFQAGWQWGLLRGSLLYRVPPPVPPSEAPYGGAPQEDARPPTAARG